jgi:hypothetical protein
MKMSKPSETESQKQIIWSSFISPNAELSRNRRGLGADEAGEQRISHRDRKQKGRRLSAPVKS